MEHIPGDGEAGLIFGLRRLQNPVLCFTLHGIIEFFRFLGERA